MNVIKNAKKLTKLSKKNFILSVRYCFIPVLKCSSKLICVDSQLEAKVLRAIYSSSADIREDLYNRVGSEYIASLIGGRQCSILSSKTDLHWKLTLLASS